jgi:transcriptional regulator with XRE-family HTH domain
VPSQAVSDSRTILAANILRARLSAGLTQRALAEQLNVDQMLVSKWERGIHRPSDENLAALSTALGLTVAWLYTEHPPG